MSEEMAGVLSTFFVTINIYGTPTGSDDVRRFQASSVCTGADCILVENTFFINSNSSWFGLVPGRVRLLYYYGGP